VLEGGAPGIHLYAFNNHDTVLATLREAGIIPATEETS
jgi:methylenetetrahydrofolate reductase (NADPH)